VRSRGGSGAAGGLRSAGTDAAPLSVLPPEVCRRDAGFYFSIIIYLFSFRFFSSFVVVVVVVVDESRVEFVFAAGGRGGARC